MRTRKFAFKLHFIDIELPPVPGWAQTALADLDNDGKLEFILGRRFGEIYWYKFHSPDRWSKHMLGEYSASDVGGCVMDVDEDGYLDFVTGGVWYRNSRDPEKPFERIVFDPKLDGVHDIIAADIDGDGKQEIITMSDRNNLRWYKIPDDPTKPWIRYDIGPSVHAGIAAGDIDGDGDLDIVRSDVWFENVKGDGTKWVMHRIPIKPVQPPPDMPFAINATKCVVCDVNKDGFNDIVYTDAEAPGGRVWWMENVDGKGGKWKEYEIYPGTERRGAFHSLYVGDFDGDADVDVLSCEMEHVIGDNPPRWYIWENVDGFGKEWKEHVILNANLGGHEIVVGDITGNGLLDIIGKPWAPRKENALEGKMFVVFLENQSDT